MITALKRFSTAAQPQSSSKWMLYAGAGAVVGGVGYYYTTAKTPIKKAAVEAQSYVPAFDGKWKEFKLLEKTTLNHNVARFRFALPEGATEVGLPTASCVMVKHKAEGDEKPTIRPYTPIEPDVPSNYFDLVVKAYPDGKMSKHIHSLKPNDVLEMKGPNLKFKYEPGKFKQIGMVCGGSGLTPMYQILQKIANNPEDKTKVDLIFANVTEGDIFLKKELDALAAKKKEQITIHYNLDKAPRGWKGPTGYVNEALLTKYMPRPSEGKVFVCGPPGMMNAISGPKAPDYTQGEIGGMLKKMGYKEEDVFKF